MNFERPVQYVLLIILACFIFGGGFLLGRSDFFSPPAPDIIETQVEENTKETSEEIVVYVSGAVQKPGVYRLKPEARIVDALEVAQPLAEADLEKINLAQALIDGQQIPIPYKGEGSVSLGLTTSPPTSATESNSVNSSPNQKININTANQAELETLPGIGPALAQRIITYRTEHGPFRTPEDLKEVSGIGDKRYADLAPLITVY